MVGPHATCGTEDGYKRHAELFETACRECLDAIRATVVRLNGPPRPAPVQRQFASLAVPETDCGKKEQHGTYAAHGRHVYRGDDPCDECKTAYRRYQHEYYVNVTKKRRGAQKNERNGREGKSP